MSNDNTRSAVKRSFALLAVKVTAFLVTGSGALFASMLDSLVDVVASTIADRTKVKVHFEAHQIAMIQATWIIIGSVIVFLESIKGFNAPVEMASVGAFIMALTLVVDTSIVRKLMKDPDPVVQGLKEDIMADISTSLVGLITMVAIVFGAPMQVDKIAAIALSVFLFAKGLKLFNENMVEASVDHQAEHDSTPEVEQEGFGNLAALS
jgi:ferrous-iron efflux pump FieF